MLRESQRPPSQFNCWIIILMNGRAEMPTMPQSYIQQSFSIHSDSVDQSAESSSKVALRLHYTRARTRSRRFVRALTSPCKASRVSLAPLDNTSNVSRSLLQRRARGNVAWLAHASLQPSSAVLRRLSAALTCVTPTKLVFLLGFYCKTTSVICL